MNPRVTEVHPLADHVLLVTFASGETRQLDIRPYLAHAVFDRLREWSFFERVRADRKSVV